jgi:raffinose/stachyose/melibiose transport system permease protein
MLLVIRDNLLPPVSTGTGGRIVRKGSAMASTVGTTETTPLAPVAPGVKKEERGRRGPYPYWFYLPAAIIYAIFFVLPTLVSFYFSFTRWDLFTSHWIGLKNYVTFFNEQALVIGLRNTLIYAVMTSGLKVVIGLLLAVLLTSKIIARGYLRSVIFFPVLVSVIGVGFTFTALMNPEIGLINKALGAVGIDGPGWLTNPSLAIFSIALVDVWKGVGLATVIFIAGIVSIPSDYHEAAQVDGASRSKAFWSITLPLARPAVATVITLSLIGGLRSFDLIWAMTGGGPGFASDTVASVIFKQYQAGFYGLSTAGSVVLFLLVTVIIVPLTWWLNRHEVDR